MVKWNWTHDADRADKWRSINTKGKRFNSGNQSKNAGLEKQRVSRLWRSGSNWPSGSGQVIGPGLNTGVDEQKSDVKLLSKAVLTSTAASTWVSLQEKEKHLGYIIIVSTPMLIISSPFTISSCWSFRSAAYDGALRSGRQQRPLISTLRRWCDVGLLFQVEWICRWSRCGRPTKMKGVRFGFVGSTMGSSWSGILLH